MGKSRAQEVRESRICQCGCGETFYPFPKYRPRSEGGGLKWPEYKRGHHPNTPHEQVPGWNRGMKKGDHPSLERMGYQPGHEPHNDWSHVNEMLANDPDLKARWLEAKMGKTPWNKGLSIDGYPNPFPIGKDHGNWCGGKRGFRDSNEYRHLKLKILKRDNYTCQLCGDRNHKGRGKRITLHVDHIVPVCIDPSLGMEPSNLRVLCVTCHRKTDTYGTKVLSLVKKKRSQSKQGA